MADRSYVGFLFHVAACGLFLYADNQKIFIPGSSDTYGGRYKYFTVLNVFLCIGYFAFASILDFYLTFFKDDIKISNKQRIRDYFFLCILFPVSAAVSILFWGIYAIEPELMLPAEKLKYMPLHGFYNHAVHTAPIFAIMLECFITHHRPPSSFIKGCLGWTVYAVTYLSWILWVAYYADIWVYPFLKIMSALHRVYFFAGTFVFGAILHKVALVINHACWRCKEDEKLEKMD